MNEFLSQFKKLSPITAPQGSKLMTGKEIFFMLKKANTIHSSFPWIKI